MTTKIIIDFETSGLNPYHDDIIEVAMKVLGTENKFTTLLKPKSNVCISERITCLTGITNRMLSREGKDWQDAYKSLNDWLYSVRGNSDKLAIIAHNGDSFDFIFLRRIFKELSELNIDSFPCEDIIFIDTLLISKRLLKGNESHRQSTLCSQFNIKSIGAHRAMNDVIALENIFVVFMKKLDECLDLTEGATRENPELIYNYIKFK